MLKLSALLVPCLYLLGASRKAVVPFVPCLGRGSVLLSGKLIILAKYFVFFSKESLVVSLDSTVSHTWYPLGPTKRQT